MALKRVSISLLLLSLVLIPFVQSSRPPFRVRKVAEASAMATTQELEANLVKLRVGKAGGSALTNVEYSARQVPTGPDPLHHNDNPAGP